MALTQPGFLTMSSKGDLAFGNWQINPDCSQDRPAGFIVFDPRGELTADVRAEENYDRY